MELGELWEAKQQGCERARETLILRFLPLVEATRQRVVPNVPFRIDVEDLIAVGMRSLIESVDRFDPGRGVRFQSFAITRLRGAMLEHLRQDDWVPRSVRTKERRGEPVDLIQLLSLEDLTCYGLGDQDDLSIAETLPDPNPGPEAVTLQRLEAEQIDRTVSLLPPSRRQVIRRYFWGDKTMKQIAGELDRSESRVHQLHAAGLGWLRESEMIEAEETGRGWVWTAEQDEGLLRALKDGLTHKQAAIALGRSPGAVAGRVSLLRKQGRLKARASEAKQEEPMNNGAGAVSVAQERREERPRLAGLDPEIEAMALVLQALAGLDTAARVRVMDWAAARFQER